MLFDITGVRTTIIYPLFNDSQDLASFRVFDHSFAAYQTLDAIDPGPQTSRQEDTLPREATRATSRRDIDIKSFS